MTRFGRWFGCLGAASACALGCSDTGSSLSPSNHSGGSAGASVGVAGGGSASQLTAGSGGAASNAGAAGSAGSEELSPTLTVGRLRTEYRVNPIGIDPAEPRFDWLLESDARAQRQTAYRLLVASTPELLSAGSGDLWDSGKVSSSESIQIAYAGMPLTARQRAWWKVRVWDANELPSAWSEPAFWERGLSEQDWQATWLSSDEGNASLTGAAWIWAAEGDPRNNAAAGARYFRKAFTLPAGVAIERATCSITADDELELFVNGQSLGPQTRWQDVKVLDVTALLTSGSNLLAVRATNTSAGPAGLIARLTVELANGTEQALATDATWKASATSSAGWQDEPFDDAGWASALELGDFGTAPWGTPSAASGPAYFRKEFNARQVKRARLYATALGVYELWLNGKRVGQDYLAPGFTDYRKRLQVQTYDVTDLLVEGDNALGAILADGWFNGKYFVFGRGDFYGSGPNRLLAELELELEDGTRQVIGTSAKTEDGWRQGTGPILSADLLDGETYDARAEQDGWSSPGFDDGKWVPTRAYSDDTARLLVGDVTDHVQKVEELEPLSVEQISPGVYVYDLGQNMVGWARLELSGTRGARVQLRFAEVLNPDGTIYVKNLRSARATDTYVLRGGGPESYEPRFTTHGFRYVELTGDVASLSQPPSLDTLTGVVLQSRQTATGTFSTSDELVNKLQHNLVWGQRGNFVSVPTDCPQRDERQGWMGDAQVFVKTSTFNFDVASFFTKWLFDVDDGQTADGAFSEIAPNPDWNKSTPAWGDAGVIVPWTLYLAYGDTRLLETHYPSMKAWVDYVHGNNASLLWQNATGSNYGDWLSINADTDKAVLATSFFAHSTNLVARTARVLGKASDAAKYEQLFDDIKQAYLAAYVSTDGKIQSETQTAYALALRFELLPEALRSKAAQHLAADVETRGVLTTGFIGVAHLLPALTLGGRTDLAYQLLQNQRYPSWLYSINKGATTIWERWDGIMENGQFQTEGMNSFNHYSFGAVGEWMYSTIAGIELDEAEPAYRHFFIRPQPGGKLSEASATLDTINGTIATSWKLTGDQFSLALTVPPNTRATLRLPFSAPVLDSGMPLTATADGSYELGSGKYELTATVP
jgi:alpha-L-rhamnosidase